VDQHNETAPLIIDINIEEFYNILYYYKRRIVWLDLTVQNILYYFFIVEVYLGVV
jgi:hypothetical protein